MMKKLLQKVTGNVVFGNVPKGLFDAHFIPQTNLADF
jgi:hypothetical protein